MKLLLAMCVFVLPSCGGDVEDRLYNDPFSGKLVPAKTVDIDGWNVSTVNGGEVIIVSKNGENIVGVGSLDGGRNVTVFSSAVPEGAVSLTDENSDTVYESIVYRSGDIQITDIGLDGIIDGVLDFNKKSLLVNHNGKLLPIHHEGDESYVLGEGSKVAMTRRFGVYVEK